MCCANFLQGWLPRSGLLYGTDFTLYQAHPSIAHSTFSVVVLPLLQSTSDGDGTSNSSHLGSSMEVHGGSMDVDAPHPAPAASSIHNQGQATCGATPSTDLSPPSAPAKPEQQGSQGSGDVGCVPHSSSSELSVPARSYRQLDWHDLQITARVVGTVRRLHSVPIVANAAACMEGGPAFLSRVGTTCRSRHASWER